MAKRDFGSFHSSNVQELISIPDEQYEAPPIPDQCHVDVETIEIPFKFGKVARDEHFLLESCTFINHGAFGAVLKNGLDCAQKWQRYIERQPLRFYDRELLPHLVCITRRLASFVGAEASGLVLVPNVTTAINCILRSQKLKPADSVFFLGFEYGAVKKIIDQVCKDSEARSYSADFHFPIRTQQQIIDLVDENLEEGTTLAVFDHIPSNTPFILPIKQLVEICHKKNVKILVDGAHALGQLDLNLSSLGVDYYVSNAHKWFCAPKGSAFMYVANQHRDNIHPLTISHGYGSGFNSEFMWSGLRDYSSFLALHYVIDFWQKVGPDHIRNYDHSLLVMAAKYLVEKWDSDVLAPIDMCGSLACVKLPKLLIDQFKNVDYSVAESIQNKLYFEFNIEVPIKAVQGQLYVRLSVHLYNEINEYHHLGDAVMNIIEQMQMQTKDS